jgi:hypothetical protein
MFKRHIDLKFFTNICMILLLLSILDGCSSSLITIATAPPQHYTKLGPVKGSATGSLCFLDTDFYFIPLGLNDRVERAYKNALKSAPNATGLINVTYQENWYWWVIGTAREVTIYGEAIKEDGK